jgi:hypothetical protein
MPAHYRFNHMLMKKIILLFLWLFIYDIAFGQAPQLLPFSQNWSNAGLITLDDNWGGVPGIQGRRGDNITGGTGVDPQTLLAADDPGVVDVNANRGDPNTFATGGVTEFDAISNGTKVVALQGSGTADAPYLLIGIITTGLSNIVVQYNVRDIDSSSDNSIQQVALQYRIGNSGAFTNIPAGYIADATTGPSLNNLVTAVNVTLPVACENQAEVQLRIMTTNAVGNDVWVGIDDISITGTAAACNITSVTFSNVSSCNDNGTPSNPADDYFTATITVTYVNPPAAGNLTLSGDVLVGGGALSVAAPFTSPTVFAGVRLKADGTPSVVTAAFSASPSCTFTVDNGPNVLSCSNAMCDLASAGLTDVHCENNNETFNDDTDDYIWFQLNPTGTDLGSGYDVSVSSGSVLLDGNTAPDNVPYGNSRFFRLQAGSAGGGNVTVTITDDDDPNCTIDVLIVDPGPCSDEPCEITEVIEADIACEDDEQTPGNPNDDDITFSLFVNGVGVGTGYNLTVDLGVITYIGGAPASDIPYNATNLFRISDMAGMGFRTVTITDNEDPQCNYLLEIQDPGSCSIPVCDIDITAITVDHETCPGDEDGSITITATCTSCTGLEYSLDGTNWQPSNTFTDLAPGAYTVYARDTGDPDCVAQDNTNINAGDNVPPVFDQNPLPADQTVNCHEPIPAAATLTATDAVSGPAMVSFSASETPGNCPQEKTITRTWTAEDACGNEAVHTQIITVVDNDPPVLNGLPNITLSIECDQPLPAVPNVTASDLCDTNVPVTYTTTTTAGSCPQEKTITRTWSATDDCGNNASFTQTITVTDNTAPVFNQNPLPEDITVSCSDIPDPEVLDGTDNCDPGIPVPVIFINEIHYDNTGADVNEFIEVAGTAGTDLSQYQLVLYNGANGTPYNTLVLSGVIDNEGAGFGAVSFAYPVNGIQNGAPDGVVLATTAGVVLQFLSYEGAFVAVGGVADGLTSANIGVLEDGNNALGTSLYLTGTGQEYDDFTWVGPLASSAGTLNTGQVINPLPGVIPAVFSQMVTPGDCNGESTITRMWQLTDACGNSVTHTQVLTVSDTEGPSFSPPPLPMDITLSCEQPVPPAPVLTAADLCDVPGNQMERVWINEIHYDNTGGDVGEFIEVAGTAGTNLGAYSLVLYNGNGGASYNTLVLSGVIPNLANGFGTLCFNYPANGIQNGAPDGVALVHDVMGGMVVQFLSYEGAFVATNGPANGLTSTDIGVFETGTEPIGLSLYLTGNGDQYGDFTWTGPLAATNCGVNTGQTFVAASMGPVVTFQETEEPGACDQERFIYRTWTATDDCGNETVLNQTITITDDIAPTVNCPANITLNLDIYGNASLSLNDINFSYSDNCADVDDLVVLPFPTRLFDCDDEGTTQQVTISVQDPCGNTGTCTINVTIAPFARCTPVVLITDPCVCKNNATTLTNGQFGEAIKIESLAGKTWTVIANTGLYQANSPAPPSAPVLIPVGTILQENPVPSGDYYLNGIHVDAQGYSITFRSERGELLTIGNQCEYPNPSITADLSGPFCLFSDPVNLTGNPGDANIISQGFTVNGVPATVFDPSQGVGQYHIVYTVNGGTPKAFGPNDPGCIQSVSLFVNVLPTPANLTCNNLVTVALDDDDCAQELLPDMALEGTYNCFDDYIVELDETLPFGNGPWLPPFLDAGDIGKTYQFRVTHLVSGNKCWGTVKVEDKLAPVIVCENFSVPCNTPNLTPDYLFNTLGIFAANPTVTDCQSFTLTYIDTEIPQNCASGLTKVITRKWTARDASGNTSTCEQTIGLIRPTLADVSTPPDYDGIDAPGFACTSSYPTPEWIENQGLQGFPYVFGEPAGCNLNWEYHDFRIEVCDGTYKIRREWTIVDWCIGDGIIYNQIIKVEDKQGPAMTCPANLTVSVNPFNCCANVDLPNIVIADECSRINNIGGMVTTFDPETNAQTGMFLIGGSLQDFPGNNHWDPDTLAAFGITTCLPIGSQIVMYMAEDDCGNATTCTFRLTIRDLVPPVASCDQTTTVAIGTDDPLDCYGPAGLNGQPAALDACSFGGVTWVKASTFNDGSYDQCNNLKLTIRRMAPYSDCIENLNANRGTLPCDAPNQSFPSERDRAITEQDSIKFYCCEVGTTQTIILTAYQVDLNGNIMIGLDGSPIKNECMIQVEVQDKLKPSCVPPPNVSVDCENFDPSLWTYGKAQVADNCCLDITKEYQGQCGLTHSANYAQFDTVCNKGTITRTFRSFDCYGQSSQCTQRVVVTYNQDYFLVFPNDAIVTVCNDSARYTEPRFFGEDCELLGFTYEDEIFDVVPDACFKIERTWTIINWCTYNPNGSCIEVPNPNPIAALNHSNNLPGPTVSACNTLPPWKSTVIKINPTDPVATDYCIFWEKDANCYKYKQIIKVIDTKDPIVDNCLQDTTYCDVTTNASGLWNHMDWWDNLHQSHDLCEGPVDLTLTARDLCSGTNVSAHFLLFLDLDNNGSMETVVNSLNPPAPGVVYYDNVNTPNFGGGVLRQFDNRGLPLNQTYRFALQQGLNAAGNRMVFAVRWNTQQSPNVYTPVEFPYGTHKIKWFITDGCGNETVCEYNFTVRDCKPPTVVCLNGLSANIMPTGMIQLWASDFLQYTEDNCTSAGQLKIASRKCGEGTGIPTNPDGSLQTSVAFNCSEIGTQCVELWSVDAAGNADYCEIYVIVQDNLGGCSTDFVNVAGELHTEMTEGVEEAMVKIEGVSSFTPPFSYFDLSDANGHYEVMNNIPLDASFTIAPEKTDNPLNGVTTYDLVLISQHILAIQALDSPYKMIAADANKSGSITTFDIVELRKLILGIYTELPNNDSWRFVDYSFVFPNPLNPFETAFPESISVANAFSNMMQENFMGVKVGDVNYSAIPNATSRVEERSQGTAIFDLVDRTVASGENVEVTFKSAQELAGFQFTLLHEGLELLGVVDAPQVSSQNFGAFDGITTVSVDGAQGFTLRFQAKKAGKLSELLQVSGAITRAEAYARTGADKQNIALRFDGKKVAGLDFELYQNQPNPFVNKTTIGFFLPEASEATLSVLDETGRLVYQQKGQFPQGHNTVVLDRSLLNTSGVLYYKLETETASATRKMIQAK